MKIVSNHVEKKYETEVNKMDYSVLVLQTIYAGV